MAAFIWKKIKNILYASVKFLPNKDQNKIFYGMGYSFYEFDFINIFYFPFHSLWSFSPNYIKIEKEFAEFYYCQNA